MLPSFTDEQATVAEVVSAHTLPPAFGGDTALYVFALFSVTAIACLSVMLAGWMVRDTWRDRRLIRWGNSIYSFRLVVGLVGVVGFMRTAPEAAYLFVYGDKNVPPEFVHMILEFRQVSTALSVIPFVAWAAIITISYAGIVHQMKTYYKFEVEEYKPVPKLIRPFLALLIVLCVAFLVAVGK